MLDGPTQLAPSATNIADVYSVIIAPNHPYSLQLNLQLCVPLRGYHVSNDCPISSQSVRRNSSSPTYNLTTFHLAQTQTTDTNKPNYSLFPSQSRPFTGDFAGPQSQSCPCRFSRFFFLALFSQLHTKHTHTHKDRVTIECCQIFAPLNNIKSKTRLTICHSINLNGFCPSPAGVSTRFFAHEDIGVSILSSGYATFLLFC